MSVTVDYITPGLECAKQYRRTQKIHLAVAKNVNLLYLFLFVC